MADLMEAINCIRAMKGYGTYDGQRIGVINHRLTTLTDVISGFPVFRKGMIVLFREEMEPTDSQLQMGEYMGMAQRPTGRVTIETPLSFQDIERERLRGSLITTVGLIVDVPGRYVSEIKRVKVTNLIN